MKILNLNKIITAEMFKPRLTKVKYKGGGLVNGNSLSPDGFIIVDACIFIEISGARAETIYFNSYDEAKSFFYNKIFTPLNIKNIALELSSE